MEVSIFISLAALAISVWGRFETYRTLKRQTRLDIVKRVGEALVTAQIYKNSLSDQIDECEELIRRPDKESIVKEWGSKQLGINVHDVSEAEMEKATEAFIKFYETVLSELNDQYKKAWDMVREFEKITLAYTAESTDVHPYARIEAMISHLNQSRILSDFNIKYYRNMANRRL